jgi:outer membrane receptor protein involved in Fe transport
MRMRANQPPGAARRSRPTQPVAQAPADPRPATPGDPPASSGDPPPVEPAPPVPETAGGPALSDDELRALAEHDAGSETIVVTGSRIERRAVDSPSPVTVLDNEQLSAAGITNLGEILQRIPAQGNALNAQFNNGGNGSTNIDLRSLGPNRTLTLINGRRVVPSGTGANSAVDFGTLPLAMIERVEVLKDGASAVYGSDAISGVVNVITRSNLNGSEASLYTSSSQVRDGANYDASFATGHTSNKGNISFAVGYQQQQPIMAGDREFARQTYTFDFTCTPQGEAHGECSARKLAGSPASASGRINTMPNGGPAFTVPGCTDQFCTADGKGGFRNYVAPTATSLGDNYNFQPLNYLLTPSTHINLFGNGHYNLAESTQVFFEAQFNSRRSTQQLAEEPIATAISNTPISKDSVYNPIRQDITDYSRRLTEFGPRTANQEVDTSRIVFGFSGALGSDVPVIHNWKWEASYNYGRTDGTNSTRGDLILSRLGNALGPSFIDPADGPQCGSQGHVIADCVPLNLLTPGHVDPAAIKYLTFTGTNAGFNEQHTAQATASGKLVDLPNRGDISAAIGGDYRRETGAFEPDPLTATGDTTGIAASPTSGGYHVLEAFSELSVVPYAGGDVVKWAELNVAGRVFDYNTFGAGVTGKLTGLVRTAGGLALRGTYGNSFNAPNIAQLFAGRAEGFVTIEDPCDTLPPSANAPMPLDARTAAQCAKTGVPANSRFGSSQQRGQFGANPSLKPETANVATAGLVYEPIKGADLTLDYWHIQINDAITALPVPTILSQCYLGGQDSFCKQIERDPVSHAISHIDDSLQNIGGTATSGLDFSAAYRYKTSAGTFRHAIEGTYLFKYNNDTGTVDPATGKEQILHNRGNFDFGVLPNLKATLLTTWNHPSGLGAGANVRFINSFRECDNSDCNDPTNLGREVARYVAGDVFVNYALKTSQGMTRMTFGINNVGNAAPPLIYTGVALNTDPSAYDFIGRQFYLRLGQEF